MPGVVVEQSTWKERVGELRTHFPASAATSVPKAGAPHSCPAKKVIRVRRAGCADVLFAKRRNAATAVVVASRDRLRIQMGERARRRRVRE